MKDLALIYQPYVPSTHLAARSLAEYLDRKEIAHELRSAHELTAPANADLHLAVCFGGDGTALRTARWLSSTRAPVVPIKMGKLSFLGELPPEALPEGIAPYLRGDFWLDERAMLSLRSGDQEQALALNDVVMARGESPRAVSVELEVDGASVVTYLADGLIVSTATGSTAYSLAAGGPVLSPRMRAMIVTPIAPHLTPLRSLVLPEGSRVRLINRGHSTTVLTADGQLDLAVGPGHDVEITLAQETGLFARRGDRSAFYEGLAAKLART